MNVRRAFSERAETAFLLKGRMGWVVVLLGTVLLGSCSVAKRLPPGEKLYAGSEIRLTADSTISKRERKGLQEQMEALTRPRPNKRIFGFPFKVWMYYWVKDPVREGSFSAWFRKRFGEPPVLASAKSIGSSRLVMESYLENEGYFRSRVTGKLVEKGYNATGVYEVRAAQRYLLDSIGFLADSTPVRKAVMKLMDESVLKKGQPYRFANIQIEQQRINQALRQQGYYYFQPDYVVALADSAVGDHRLRLILAVRPDLPAAAAIPYSFRNITIVPSAGLRRVRPGSSARGEPASDSLRQARQTRRTERAAADSLPSRFRRGYVFDTFRVVDTTGVYDPRLFRSILGFRPGELYDSRKQDLTLSRFINVGVFKFVRNRFTPATQRDSAVLDVVYSLTPYPKKSIRVEIAGVSKSNNLVGSELTLSWLNRNTMRRAELFTINGTAGIEQQYGARSLGVTNYSLGINATLSFPRLLSPIRLRYDRNQLLPKTNISLSHQLIIRRGLYNLNSSQAAYGYEWRTSIRSQHVWQPLSLTFVRTSRYSERFLDLQRDPQVPDAYIRNLQRNQLIPAIVYSYTFNSSPQTASPYTFRMVANLEESGGLVGLFVKRTSTDTLGMKKQILGVPFEQYVRIDLDTRHLFRLSSSLVWANRIQGGLGVPYGNWGQLPFIKQFFVGGSNSLRGFRPRTVGPGLYQRQSGSSTPLLQDGGGDIKLEANTELRKNFTQLLQGALFIDVGNVWMYRDESSFGPGTRFTNQFLKQLAVSTGVGLRIDLSYFVLRFDLATPVRKPWLPETERWVFNQINFRDPEWRRQNLVLNVAVGYPF